MTGSQQPSDVRFVVQRGDSSVDADLELIHGLTSQDIIDAVADARSGTSAPGSPLHQQVIRAPAGTDITAQIQSAINTAVAAGVGLDLLIAPTTAGALHLDGAVQTGTALGYSYAGQILFPARDFPAGRLTIRVRGASPSGIVRSRNSSGEPAATGGTVLLSSATSGYVFDAIPARQIGGVSFPFTNLTVIFEDITVRCPDNPQCGGVNLGAVAAAATRGSVSIDTNAVGNVVTFPTGTLPGLVLPGLNNMALSHLGGEVEVVGFPIGVVHSEHSVFDNLTVQNCAAAIQPRAANGHASHYGRVLVQGCPIALQAPTTGTFYGGPIKGLLDAEVDTSGVWALTKVVDDSSNLIQGSLAVLCTTAPTKGFPVTGGLLLDVSNAYLGGTGWMSSPPLDTFTRVVDSATFMGRSDQTCHPWVAAAGAWKTASGQAFATTAGIRNVAYARYFDRASAGSRTVLATITTQSGAYNFGVMVNRCFANGNYIFATLQGGTVKLNLSIGGVVTQVAAGGTVAASTTYAVAVVVARPAVGPFTVTVYINGAQACTYTLDPTTEAPMFVETSATQLRADGLYANDDLVSYCSQFQVVPTASMASVPLSLIDAADDLIVGAGDNTAARVAVGASTIIGKKASGALKALTPTEANAILGTAPSSDMLPWAVRPNIYMPATASVGTWARTIDTSSIYNGRVDSDATQNARIDFDLVLAAGTWTFDFLHLQSNTRGIYTIQLDDGAGTFSTLGTIDGYNAATTRHVLSQITGIVVASAIKRTLRVLMATKNASSTGYLASIHDLGFRRTA